MRIKKFVARDFQSAIKQAKKEMGIDAIILHSKQVKRGGLLGFLYPPQVEITVAVDSDLQVDTDRKRRKGKEEPVLIETPPAELLTAAASSPEPGGELLSELKDMKSLISQIKSRMYELEVIEGMDESVQAFYEILIHNNVEREIALSILSGVVSRLENQSVKGENTVKSLCLQALAEYFSEIQPINIKPHQKGSVVFVVGPTGVGKTTTIAKLAANMTFLDDKEIALITLDTYRVSAAEQLRTFAEIIGIPIRVVFNPPDLLSSIEQFNDKDLIFVDTAGRSPYNQVQMEELKEFIQMANPDETVLVLSVTTDSTDLLSIYQRFEPIGIDKIIFTKLDETHHYGPILNTIYEIKKPIAYFTTGQNVPDDIEVPDSARLAQMLLEGDGA